MAELANERGLSDTWLNDAALAYIPPVGPDDWVEVFRIGNVSVSIGSVQMLLAMKLLAIAASATAMTSSSSSRRAT